MPIIITNNAQLVDSTFIACLFLANFQHRLQVTVMNTTSMASSSSRSGTAWGWLNVTVTTRCLMGGGDLPMPWAWP